MYKKIGYFQSWELKNKSRTIRSYVWTIRFYSPLPTGLVPQRPGDMVSQVSFQPEETLYTRTPSILLINLLCRFSLLSICLFYIILFSSLFLLHFTVPIYSSQFCLSAASFVSAILLCSLFLSFLLLHPTISAPWNNFHNYENSIEETHIQFDTFIWQLGHIPLVGMMYLWSVTVIH